MEQREVLEMEGDTRLERFKKARQFKELSKALYVVTKVRFEIFRHDDHDAQLWRYGVEGVR